MREVILSEKTNDFLSNRLNRLFEKISNRDTVEGIIVSSFEAFDSFNIFNSLYFSIDIVFNDEDYYNSTTDKIITNVELYTFALSKLLSKKGLELYFNVRSCKRSDYYKEKSILLDYLHRSEIVYDKYGDYTRIKNDNVEYEDFSNTVYYNPPLRLKKI